MSLALDVLSWICLLVGGALVFIGGIGMVRLPDVLTRMHAASLADTGASVLILLGLMIQSGLSLVTFKLFATLFFLLFTGPTASYALGNALLRSGYGPGPLRANTADPPDRSEETPQ
ncbi:MAG: monovalent cation/H(+) antiporter subunit G [Rhodothalassiaceae bacterium]